MCLTYTWTLPRKYRLPLPPSGHSKSSGYLPMSFPAICYVLGELPPCPTMATLYLWIMLCASDVQLILASDGDYLVCRNESSRRHRPSPASSFLCLGSRANKLLFWWTRAGERTPVNCRRWLLRRFSIVRPGMFRPYALRATTGRISHVS